MQHYTKADRMLTIHGDRLIKDWELRPEIAPEDVRGLFNYELRKCPCFDMDGREVPNVYHVEKFTPGATSGEIMPLGGFGPNYTILQNSAMLDMIADKILPELPGARIETAGTLEGGATGLVQISCGRDFSIKGDKSRQESRLYFNNPTGGGCLVMGFCLTRCVCENTIAAARKEVIAGARFGDGSAMIKHTTSIDVYAKRAIEQIAAQAKATKAMQERIKALAAKQVSAKQIKAALAEVFPASPELAESAPAAYTNAINKREEVIAQWESGETAETFTQDTAWKLFNAFTFPIFNPQKISKGSDLSGIRYDGLFGDRADKVGEILETIERIAA